MNACCLIYGIFQFVQIADSSSGGVYTQPYLAATIGVLSVCQLAFTFLVFQLYMEFGWKIYKKIGADIQMKSMKLLLLLYIFIYTSLPIDS